VLSINERLFFSFISGLFKFVVQRFYSIDDRMINECGEVGGIIIIGSGNRRTRRNSVPVSLCPPQISQELTMDRARAATVGRQ
jgi:glycopeptide antibiotics resistance protein